MCGEMTVLSMTRSWQGCFLAGMYSSVVFSNSTSDDGHLSMHKYFQIFSGDNFTKQFGMRSEYKY